MSEIQATTDLKLSPPDVATIRGIPEALSNATIGPLITEQAEHVNCNSDSVFDSITFIKDFLWAGQDYQRILEIEQTLIQANYNHSQPESSATAKLIDLAMNHAVGMSPGMLLDCWSKSCHQLQNESTSMQLPLEALRNACIHHELGLIKDSVMNCLSNQTTLKLIPKIELPLSLRIPLVVQNEGLDWAKYILLSSAIAGLYLSNSGDPKYFAIIAGTSLAFQTLLSAKSSKDYFQLDRSVCAESNSYYQALCGPSVNYVPFDIFAKNLYQGTESYSSADHFLALRINRLLNYNFEQEETHSSDSIQLRAYQALARAPFECHEPLENLVFETADRFKHVKQALLSLDRIEFEWLRYQGRRFRELLCSNICLQAPEW